ncbi:DUF4330 domain-containing protein [Halorussus lipolyticus]|uniref:DUF4330 domain-containing protein n=1 Tax=Halorussus lipolyticus TaxID=3034024 RepID=UPI0023E8E47B|nr:DUF4330 domain-containing protein [Halorussus sp. DT80]
MAIIDEKGRLFGKVNVVDAFVLLLVLTVVGVGGAFVLGGGGDSTGADQTATVRMEVTEVQPYVADAISTGPVGSDGVVAVRNKSVGPAIVTVTTANGTLRQREHPRKRTVELSVELDVTGAGDDPTFKGKELEVGRTVTLDLGRVTVEGPITAVGTEE